jgi:tRNA pseudouridine13 synthase
LFDYKLKNGLARILLEPESSPNFYRLMIDLPRVYDGQLIEADLRTYSSDFKVNEVLSFEPSGSGEHLFIFVEKHDCNTDWVIRQLCKKLGLTSKQIGYAGKKDRHSVSRQWFSLHLPGVEVSAKALNTNEFKVLQSIRHNKKLRVGSLLENQFEIILRNLSGQVDPLLIEKVKENGVPNYFGLQRFGIGGGNLERADLLLAGSIKIKNRNKRGMVISSARSFLFNLILAERVKANSWCLPINGDCLVLNGSRSYFHCEHPSQEELLRASNGDVHVSGVLVGKDDSEVSAESLAIENSILQAYPSWCAGLKKLNVDSARRAFRVVPKNLEVSNEDNSLKLCFSLARGCFATSVIRELVDVNDRQRVQPEQTSENSSGTRQE